MAVLVLAALGLLAASGAAQYWIAHTALEQRQKDDARLAAESAAQALGQLADYLGRTLDGLAREPRLTNVLASGDATAIQAEQARLAAVIPGALLVRLLPDANLTPDESQTPAMSFADLEMVRLAYQASPQAALHGANTPHAHIALARKLAAGGGAILASLSPNLLQQALAGKSAAGALELRQDTLPLAYQGDSELKSTEPAGELPVSGSPWKIVYWSSESAAWGLAWLILPLLLAGAALAALAGFALRRLERAFAADVEAQVKLVSDLMSGKTLGNYPLTIADHHAFVRRIAELKRMGVEAPAAANKKKPAPVSRAESADNAFLSPGSRQQGRIDVEEAAPAKLPASIFRAYDIRGVVGQTLTPDIVLALGRAIGSEAHFRGEQRVAVARDGRLSSPDLAKALIEGLKSTGRTVIDIGLVPTPLLYFATEVLNSKSGVMLTGSHNPADYNGLKIVIAGQTLSGDDIQKLRRRAETGDFVSGAGKVENRDLIADYTETVVQDMQIGRPLKVVIDCGNGVAAKVAPALLRALECELVELYCEVDGHFPHHHPDPSKPENLQALIDTVRREKADLGLAFDGDGDRLGVVDSSGKIIWPDRQMMVYAADVLCRQPGADIIFDVKCSRHLATQIVKSGGRPLMWKTGHSLIKAKMKETGAMLAGEMSGHIFFKERWYGFDDGIYAAARLIEILSGDPRNSAEVFAELPDAVNTPELTIGLQEGENFRFVERLKELAEFPEARVTDIDGLRVDFMNGWGLVRASNTTPSLVVRFEAESPQALARIQGQFGELMKRVKPDIALPF